MKSAIFLALILCASLQARSQSSDKVDPKQTGKFFLTMCESTDKVVHTLCVAYTRGFTDGLQVAMVYQSSLDRAQLKYEVCLPGSLQYEDVLTGFLIFLKAHPEKQDDPTIVLMLSYLTSAYECPADNYTSPKP